jgi:hypothetical protein
MIEMNDNIADRNAGAGCETKGDFNSSAKPSAVSGEPTTFSAEHHETSAVERIARVLAGRRLSINGMGASSSAGKQVDQIWESFTDDAVGILNALQDPDPAMLAAGDGPTWTAMVRAALGEPYEKATRPRIEAPAEIYQKPLG